MSTQTQLPHEISNRDQALDWFGAWIAYEGRQVNLNKGKTDPTTQKPLAPDMHPYTVQLQHGADVPVDDLLDHCRRVIAGFQTHELGTIPERLRHNAAFYLVATIGQRSGAKLESLMAVIRSLPAELLPAKFATAAAIHQWVANPDALPAVKESPFTRSPIHENKFSVGLSKASLSGLSGAGIPGDAAAVITVTAFGIRVSPDEALNLAAHLVAVAEPLTHYNFQSVMEAVARSRQSSAGRTEPEQAAPISP